MVSYLGNLRTGFKRKERDLYTSLYSYTTLLLVRIQTKMREVLKTFFVPRTHWAATNVNLVPTVATSAQLARWGGVGVFGAFWKIGTI